ncbi:methylated-DNA--[protein]-cysteine S-methyltransferase [Actinomycetota bacterium]
MSAAVLVMPSPIGPLGLVADDDALVAVEFLEDSTRLNHVAAHAPALLAETERQLSAYFAGELTEFDLPLRPEGSDFQLRVWDALRGIPFGQTRTYGQIAEAVGLTAAAASRAVGAAAGANPLPVVIPCHRVIGADGSLVGFAGGLRRKEILLAHEGLWSPSEQLELFD